MSGYKAQSFQSTSPVIRHSRTKAHNGLQGQACGGIGGRKPLTVIQVRGLCISPRWEALGLQ